MSEPTRVERAAVAVARAWNEPGPYPPGHRAAQNVLLQRWPALHRTVSELAAAIEEAQGPPHEQHAACAWCNEPRAGTALSFVTDGRYPSCGTEGHGVSFYAD